MWSLRVFNLFKHLAARHGIFVVINAILLAGFEFLICAVVSTIDIPSVLGEIMKNIPPLMRSLIEQQIFGGGFNSKGMLAFGWNHPIALAIGAAVAIVLATRALAGEIENGAIEFLLSQPISRYGYFTANVIFAILALAALSLIGASGTLIGQQTYGLRAFDYLIMLKLVLNYFLLNLVWYGVTLAISVFGREAGRVAFTGFLLALISYLIQVIGQFWSAAEFLLPYTVNTYYSSKQILLENCLQAKSIGVLISVTLVSLCAGAWRLMKRDIP